MIIEPAPDLKERPYRRTPIEERFWSKVTIQPNGCWLWNGALTSHGYGSFFVRYDGQRNITTKVHTWVYEQSFGPVPMGLCIDHTCHNRSGCLGVGKDCLHRRCVNPAHLEAVTNAVNAQRGRVGAVTTARQLAKTHCKQGHLFTIETTRYRPDGRRYCKVCWP